MQHYEVRYCTHCASALAWIELQEDGGAKQRLRCPACGWTHWNNPTPVLAAIVELDGKILLARNALWKDRFFGLITGFMEAGETPEEGIAREVLEETGLEVLSATLVDVSDFQRKNQVLIAYHVLARGQVRLSPELSEYQLVEPAQAQAWNTGTGKAFQKWLRAQGYEPVVFDRYARLVAEAEAAGEHGAITVQPPAPPPGPSGVQGTAALPSGEGGMSDRRDMGDDVGAVAQEVDAKGLRCPQPILRAKKALAGLQSGQLLRVLATDAGSLQDFAAFAKQTGNALVAQHTDAEGTHHFVLRRR
ncbi:NUDIX domain-containing protein [Allofranklinella schreckenbergeri]|uniref:NUDIX domain-containing protein n=2 Tax=Allofranklinella schreckenbergeri TaxID=1076744 RepID=A0A3M6Q4Q1_9BURK|nr:NUDIX domain-containing protein [Allofranklinella schreckenbergeri]